MKKLVVALVAVAIVAMAGSAMAATSTGTMNVSAAVNPTCTVGVITDLAFGVLDPATNGLVNATPATVNFQCTNGTVLTTSYDNGLHFGGGSKNINDGTTNIPYSISGAAPSPANGTAQSFSVTGQIAAGTYGTATAGSYSDQVVVTLTY